MDTTEQGEKTMTGMKMHFQLNAAAIPGSQHGANPASQQQPSPARSVPWGPERKQKKNQGSEPSKLSLQQQTEKQQR